MKPLIFFFFACTYGIAVLFIRELKKIRLALGPSFIFLAATMGIYIEGIFMQSFFNLDHFDLGALSGFGLWLGVQWPWSIYMIMVHGILSVALPIYLIDCLVPSYKNKTLLNKPLTIIFTLFFLLVTSVQLFVITHKASDLFANYTISYTHNFILLAIISILIYLAIRFKDYRFNGQRDKLSGIHIETRINALLLTNPIKAGLYSGLFVFILIVFSYAVAYLGILPTVLFHIFTSWLIIKTTITTIYNPNLSHFDKLPLALGILNMFAISGILQEFNLLPNEDNPAGMGYVGLSAIFLSLLLYYLSKNRPSYKKKAHV